MDKRVKDKRTKVKTAVTIVCLAISFPALVCLSLPYMLLALCLTFLPSEGGILIITAVFGFDRTYPIWSNISGTGTDGK